MAERSNRDGRGRLLRTGGIAAALVLLAAGCTAEAQRGFLPGYEDGQVTNRTGQITDLWVGSWIALMLVGLLVWGLMIWCAIIYRRRKSDTGYPVQLRYHVPLELIFTIMPIIMIMVLFYFTVQDVAEVEDTSAEPDVEIEVVGKQWSWDFNYTTEGVHEPAGVQSRNTGQPGAAAELPVLYLPVDQNIEFTLNSRDVVHSFWIPDFLYKKDMFPGHSNTFQVTPLREGVYAGKCAELCGEFHSDMLFNVAVVSQAEFDAHMQELEDAGYTGELGEELNRDLREWDMNDPEVWLENQEEEAQP